MLKLFIIAFAIFFQPRAAIASSVLTEVLNSREILVSSGTDQFVNGDRLLLKSKDTDLGILAVFEVIEVRDRTPGHFVYRAAVKRTSNSFLIKLSAPNIPILNSVDLFNSFHSKF